MAEATAQLGITEEDQLRATWYSLFARLLARPADADVLEILKGLESDGSDFGQAIAALKAAASKCPVQVIEQEHFDLFVGDDRSAVADFRDIVTYRRISI